MSKSLGTIGFRKRGDWKPNEKYRADDAVNYGRSLLYAKVDHTSGDEFEPDKWGFIADATGVEEIAERAEAAATLAETNGTEAGLQAQAAKKAAEQATEQTEAAKAATGIFTENFKFVESDDFLYAIADNLGNLLWGIRKDGSVFQPRGISEEARKRLEELSGLQIVEDDNYIFAITDSDGNLLFAIDRKGGSVINKLSGVCSIEQYEGSEYIFCVMDSADNLLFGIKRDGSFVTSKFELPSDILKQLKKLSANGMETDEQDQEFIYKILDKDGLIVFAVKWDGTSYMPKGIPEEQKAENRKLNRKLSDLEKSIANFTGGTGDWSDASYMQVPLPRCAKFNILSDRMPTAKSGLGTPGVTCDIPCQVEFWDMQGNYFKKWVLLSAQGNSSMAFTKKNLAMDFYVTREDMLNDDEKFKMKFGDWVAQDSFHLKAYYTDTFRGVGACSYLLYEEMVKTRNIKDNRPYKAAFTGDYGTSEQGVDSIDDLDKNFDTGAKCFPMPFPVIVYQNGEFYGIYSWQMKKDRDNMWQSKKKAKHVHLDGTLGADTIWGGNINWTAFEVRNPKDLIDIDGEDYDGDHPKELTGDIEVDEKTAEVKQYIIDLSGRIAELKAAESAKEVSTIQSDYNTITTNNTHTSSTGLNVLRSVAFIGKDEWLVYLTKDETGTNDSKLMNYYTERLNTANGVAAFAQKYPEISVPNYAAKVWEDSALVNESVWNTLLAQAGLDGYTLNFNGNTGNVYPTGKEISLASPTDEYPYLKIVKAHDLISAMEEYLATANEEMRTLIGKYFMPSFMVDYILETNLVSDGDGYNKNWQWTTWDGELWTANPYDHDGIFGAYHIGNFVNSPGSGWLGNSTSIPSGWIIKYFMPELKSRYAELRTKGIFDAAHIAGIIMDWCLRIGYDNFESEYERWPESPCNRPSLINSDNWTRSTSYVSSTWAEGTTYSKNGTCKKGSKVYKSLMSGNIGNDPETDDGTHWEDVTYDEAKSYAENEVCYYGKTTFYGFKCISPCQGIPPLSGFYTIYPYELGHYDSVYRVQNWLEQRIKYMDTLLGYTSASTNKE